MESNSVTLWGTADLKDFPTPEYTHGHSLHNAVSWAVPINPRIMVTVQKGPNAEYAEEYSRVNKEINDLSQKLSDLIRKKGYLSLALAASERTDTINIKGDFPHKTAATRAGIGWIGRHCQLVTRPFGSWVRLGTVFTDLPLLPGTPARKSLCGSCTACVKACPAQALKGNTWFPGIPRHRILDAHACDQWKKKHYYKYHNGHNCGICSSVCPYGLKFLKRSC